MKKKQFIPWIFYAVCVILPAAMLYIPLSPKQAVFRQVQRDHSQLEAVVTQIIEAGAVTDDVSYRGCTINYYKTPRMVEFITHAGGIVPSMNYSGFYYSASDEPLGFQGAELAFSPHGAGWRWQEPDGDNREYTEKIIGHWYWFEIYF